jgi:O-methyltransferase
MRLMSRAARAMIRGVARRPLLSGVGRRLLPLVNYTLAQNHMYVCSFRREMRWLSDAIASIRHERELMIRVDEAANLALAARAASKLPGDFAELGVYQGASAKLICQMKGERTLHLFDTFEGLPAPGPFDPPEFVEGGFRCSQESVSQYLSDYANVQFHPGVFPGTAARVADRRFAFVNLDVDLYESTYQALEFFYPRMVTSGIILSHDYAGAKGVRKAFDEFFESKEEVVMPLLGNQCMVIRVDQRMSLAAAQGA